MMVSMFHSMDGDRLATACGGSRPTTSVAEHTAACLGLQSCTVQITNSHRLYDDQHQLL